MLFFKVTHNAGPLSEIHIKGLILKYLVVLSLSEPTCSTIKLLTLVLKLAHFFSKVLKVHVRVFLLPFIKKVTASKCFVIYYYLCLRLVYLS